MTEPIQPAADAPAAQAEPRELTEAELHVFVPAHLAAVCASCGGYFVHRVGRCPGCGDSQFTLCSRDEARQL